MNCTVAVPGLVTVNESVNVKERRLYDEREFVHANESGDVNETFTVKEPVKVK